MSYSAHESAIIDNGAEIGAGSRIWHFVHVCAGAKVGRKVVLGQNVFVASGAVIGDGCRVQNNVSIYDGVILGNGVFCGPSMVFTNVINPRSGVERKDEFRSTRVGDGASFGANCTIVCGVDIGAYAFIAAGAVVTSHVPDHALMVGMPARLAGWMSRNGQKLDLPISGEGEADCPETGERYQLRAGACTRAG